jgi:hypothetical protein
MLAEVVRWPPPALRKRARNAQLRRGADVPIDFRCYVLPTATHTLATVEDDGDGLLDARSEEGGRMRGRV